MLAGVITGSALLGVLFVGACVVLTWVVGGALDEIDEAFGEGEVPSGKSLGRGGRDHAGHLDSHTHTRSNHTGTGRK